MAEAIRLRGVRQNNLKNFDLDIPVNQLTVITGVSGSGKSSLAFDTLFAEGQRRYIETFSPYARQFFDRMDKPQVDRIEGIPPAIAIEQKNTVKSTRSTVGTMTEICDYMKDLWWHFSRPYCDRCGDEVASESPGSVWRWVQDGIDQDEIIYVIFRVPLSKNLGYEECLKSIVAQGFQRCVLGGEIVKIEGLLKGDLSELEATLDLVQDRIRIRPSARQRFVEACESAFSLGGNRLVVLRELGAGKVESVRSFSRILECARCRTVVPSPTKSFFSFNSPVGACPECRGFGRVIGVDYRRAIPDSSLSVADGVVKLWQKGHGLRSQRDMMKIARRDGFPVHTPFRDLSPEEKDWVIYGTPGYGEKGVGRWPKAWYGVKGYFDWLETKSYKMHYRVLLARYRAYYECPRCLGTRFKKEVLNFRVDGLIPRKQKKAQGKSSTLHLAEFYQLSVCEALQHVDEWKRQFKGDRQSPLAYALGEVRSRLQFMVDVGLSYLTLDRPTKTLSGGETERINLTSCLGTRLVNTLFVLDEPSVGLHAIDVEKLIEILKRLKQAGNTVVVVEHDEKIMKAADHIIDIGPRSGAGGGELVYSGRPTGLARCRDSITAQYLFKGKTVECSDRESGSREPNDWLTLADATCHNLRGLTVQIPLDRLVCLTGVSGSGKTTLVRDVLVPELERVLGASEADSDDEVSQPEELSDEFAGSSAKGAVSGYEGLSGVSMVDQSPLGRTPRSNPIVYIGVFEAIRKLFASARESREAGLEAGAFSFNSPAGRCERCRGAGFEKVEMQFLSDVFVPCADCGGKRYRRGMRDFQIDLTQFDSSDEGAQSPHLWSIVDLLESTVDEIAALLAGCDSKQAQNAFKGLQWLQDVGLGYLKAGQPLNTLSGGEAQRLKVVKHLNQGSRNSRLTLKQLFVFDEPTTGLHFRDVATLLQMFRQMVNKGHSILVVEHHLDLIRASDWMIDLGPGGGNEGGRLVYQGDPRKAVRCKSSKTGVALRG